MRLFDLIQQSGITVTDDFGLDEIEGPLVGLNPYDLDERTIP